MAAFSNFFKTIMDWINGFVGNYGWSIMIMTVLFRFILIPLDVKQKVGTRKQAALQPKVDAINAKYKNDKDKAAAKTMELYKEEKFSPLSGCLPALLQMPVFFAFYGALRIIAEQELFMMFTDMQQNGNTVIQSWLWVRNMWQPDNITQPVIPLFAAVQNYASFKDLALTQQMYDSVMAPLVQQFTGVANGWFILPLLAGGSSFLQSKLTMGKQPKPAADATSSAASSSKMMQYIFPFISLFFCATSSAGFAIYWFTSNLMSIVVSLLVDKYLDGRDGKLIKHQ